MSSDAARLALYINPLGDPGSAQAQAAPPLALSVSIATWLPGGTAMPVASLCTAAQLARGGELQAAAPDGGPGCAISGPDADGWQRLAVDVDGFGAAGWDELQLSDLTGRGGLVYLDRVVLLRAADVAQAGAWDANAGYCLDRLDSMLYGCTVPPSAECCADYGRFNAQGCHCIQAVRDRASDDLQRASPRADVAASQCVMTPAPPARSGDAVCSAGRVWHDADPAGRPHLLRRPAAQPRRRRHAAAAGCRRRLGRGSGASRSAAAAVAQA